MTSSELVFEVCEAAVDLDGAAFPRALVTEILRDERALALRVRDENDHVVIVGIPMTADGHVLTAGADGGVEAVLTAAALRARFRDKGLRLLLRHPASDVEWDRDDAAFEDGAWGNFEGDDDIDDPFPAVERDTIEFSRRGIFGARFAAQLRGIEVRYTEAEGWSAFRYRPGDAGSRASDDANADAVVTVQQYGGDDAVVCITSRWGLRRDWLWPNAERTALPVLELDTLDEVARAVYERAITQVHDAQLGGLGAVVDLAGARLALRPEAFGGVVGAEERVRALLEALGVPRGVITEDPARTVVIRPRGWLATIGAMFVGGTREMLSPKSRMKPVGRIVEFLHRHPGVRTALSVGELAAGGALITSRSRVGRIVGWCFVIEALVDLAVGVMRRRVRR